ncbi:2-(3-amino-3-carboxypropyl)histidine synthase subunit 2 [Contarinia nasturtii]|uniref:2-(3-amino-3-carboxypropyl)histidine synthase subunit 2 n=1 Tax=Contarinia nasturtii TaxID=265458 RepID=UPI0012D4ABA5|nr:2-(3-amino-3-carboxypropyl)histidine synthase subunit 2 [Contarinia nasturtii]
MTSAFFTNDAECFSRDTENQLAVESLDEIWNEHRLSECVNWINEHQFEKVCLQFPDELIPFSIAIIAQLKNNSSAQLSILGDTSYGSCCVDEIASSHVSANAIIHFGHACLSKVTRLPVHYVFSNFKLDAEKLRQSFHNYFANVSDEIVIFYSTGLFYHLDDIKSALASYTNISYAELAIDERPDNLCWKLPKTDVSNVTCVWIGDDNQTFFNLSLTVNAKQWILCDRHNYELKIVQSPLATNWMRRRNFFVEKCKDAQSIGIVVGTLTADGYLNAVNRVQKLARDRGIRTYLLSVGKINPAKLANFMEIDCFVFVGCPENSIYNSRDFYKPLLSVFEAELALNFAWREQYPNFYAVDFTDILPDGKHYRAAEKQSNTNGENDYDVSLVSGRIRPMKITDNDETNQNNSTEIERKHNQLMNTNSSSAFNNRSWTGLDPSLGQHEPVKVTKGRSGIAIKYTENEHE